VLDNRHRSVPAAAALASEIFAAADEIRVKSLASGLEIKDTADGKAEVKFVAMPKHKDD